MKRWQTNILGSVHVVVLNKDAAVNNVGTPQIRRMTRCTKNTFEGGGRVEMKKYILMPGSFALLDK